MNLRKKILSLIIVIITGSMLSLNVYGNSINLSEQINITEGTTVPNSNSNTSSIINKDLLKDSSGLLDTFGELQANSSLNADTLNNMSSLVKIISNISFYIVFATFIFFVLRASLDLMYIFIPFLRKPLANGHVGNANTGLSSNNSSFGSGFGGGGFSSGFGGGGFGSGGMGQSPNNDAGTNGNRIQWVTTTALNAVMAEGNVDQNGTPVSKFKFWLNDMLVSLVVLGVTGALIVTGLLTKIMLLFGTVVVNLIEKVIG